MPDWRWITQVSHSPSPNNVLAPTLNGMWIDFDGLDSVMPLPPGRYNGANTRLGWLSYGNWHYIFVVEQIDPTLSGEQQPTTHERTIHADSAVESDHTT
jgi:hypothetical protein